MRSLEIRTQIIFNNLIKQNQKLGSDSVLQQSTTVSSVQCPEPGVQNVASRDQSSASRVQRSTLASRVLEFRMPFLFVNKTLWLNNLKSKTAINVKISVFVICDEAIINLLSYNLHYCTLIVRSFVFWCDKIKSTQ